jgi:hypothetical protein
VKEREKKNRCSHLNFPLEKDSKKIIYFPQNKDKEIETVCNQVLIKGKSLVATRLLHSRFSCLQTLLKQLLLVYFCAFTVIYNNQLRTHVYNYVISFNYLFLDLLSPPEGKCDDNITL